MHSLCQMRGKERERVGEREGERDNEKVEQLPFHQELCDVQIET